MILNKAALVFYPDTVSSDQIIIHITLSSVPVGRVSEAQMAEPVPPTPSAAKAGSLTFQAQGRVPLLCPVVGADCEQFQLMNFEPGILITKREAHQYLGFPLLWALPIFQLRSRQG